MPKKSKLNGVINQLTIYGQLEFIDNLDYQISNTKEKDFKYVSGTFNNLDTNMQENLTIEMSVIDLKKHLVN